MRTTSTHPCKNLGEFLLLLKAVLELVLLRLTDVFLWKQLPNKIESAPLCTNPEQFIVGASLYKPNEMHHAMKQRTQGLIPEEWEWLLSLGDPQHALLLEERSLGQWLVVQSDEGLGDPVAALVVFCYPAVVAILVEHGLAGDPEIGLACCISTLVIGRSEARVTVGQSDGLAVQADEGTGDLVAALVVFC